MAAVQLAKGRKTRTIIEVRSKWFNTYENICAIIGAEILVETSIGEKRSGVQDDFKLRPKFESGERTNTNSQATLPTSFQDGDTTTEGLRHRPIGMQVTTRRRGVAGRQSHSKGTLRTARQRKTQSRKTGTVHIQEGRGRARAARVAPDTEGACGGRGMRRRMTEGGSSKKDEADFPQRYRTPHATEQGRWKVEPIAEGVDGSKGGDEERLIERCTRKTRTAYRAAALSQPHGIEEPPQHTTTRHAFPSPQTCTPDLFSRSTELSSAETSSSLPGADERDTDAYRPTHAHLHTQAENGKMSSRSCVTAASLACKLPSTRANEDEDLPPWVLLYADKADAIIVAMKRSIIGAPRVLMERHKHRRDIGAAGNVKVGIEWMRGTPRENVQEDAEGASRVKIPNSVQVRTYVLRGKKGDNIPQASPSSSIPPLVPMTRTNMTPGETCRGANRSVPSIAHRSSFPSPSSASTSLPLNPLLSSRAPTFSPISHPSAPVPREYKRDSSAAVITPTLAKSGHLKTHHDQRQHCLVERMGRACVPHDNVRAQGQMNTGGKRAMQAWCMGMRGAGDEEVRADWEKGVAKRACGEGEGICACRWIMRGTNESKWRAQQEVTKGWGKKNIVVIDLSPYDAGRLYGERDHRDLYEVGQLGSGKHSLATLTPSSPTKTIRKLWGELRGG
ncbi:hypothetical protein R3P38DRAFT_3469604 [Favolaschia claudopus]|uniref:Uncharacterized protein n=1 Tax=Favolaschia claudopus TaxID=2862362 RepID=A0AAW0CPU6_9AGAR